MYEYKVVKWYSDQDIDEDFNLLGKDNWRLVTVTCQTRTIYNTLYPAFYCAFFIREI